MVRMETFSLVSTETQGSPYVRYLDMTGRNSTLIMVSLVYSKDLTGKYWRTVLPRVIINYYMRMLSMSSKIIIFD